MRTFYHQEEAPRQIVSTYTASQAVEDGELVELFKNRWEQLTHGRPILATSHVFESFSLAAFQEMYNEYARKAVTQEQKELFVTKMNNQKVWVVGSPESITFMFPEDY